MFRQILRRLSVLAAYRVPTNTGLGLLWIFGGNCGFLLEFVQLGNLDSFRIIMIIYMMVVWNCFVAVLHFWLMSKKYRERCFNNPRLRPIYDELEEYYSNHPAN